MTPEYDYHLGYCRQPGPDGPRPRQCHYARLMATSALGRRGLAGHHEAQLGRLDARPLVRFFHRRPAGDVHVAVPLRLWRGHPGAGPGRLRQLVDPRDHRPNGWFRFVQYCHRYVQRAPAWRGRPDKEHAHRSFRFPDGAPDSRRTAFTGDHLDHDRGWLPRRFSFHRWGAGAVGMVVLAELLGLAVCCVSAYIGLAVKDEESVQAFGLIWVFPLTFVSSAFVPISTMPTWLQGFATHQPFTVVINALRILALGRSVESAVGQTPRLGLVAEPGLDRGHAHSFHPACHQSVQTGIRPRPVPGGGDDSCSSGDVTHRPGASAAADPVIARALARGTASLPKHEERPQQLAMAEAVGTAIKQRRHLIVQAGTGTGKSLAYLVPALALGQRVVVSTATKALQDQLAHRDLPQLSRSIGACVSVTRY